MCTKWSRQTTCCCSCPPTKPVTGCRHSTATPSAEHKYSLYLLVNYVSDTPVTDLYVCLLWNEEILEETHRVRIIDLKSYLLTKLTRRNDFGTSNPIRRIEKQKLETHLFSWLNTLGNIYTGQIRIFHTPRCPWNKKISLTKPPFGVRSCEVAIIWPDIWTSLDLS